MSEEAVQTQTCAHIHARTHKAPHHDLHPPPFLLSANPWGTPAVCGALGSGGHIVSLEVVVQVRVNEPAAESDLDKKKRRR